MITRAFAISVLREREGLEDVLVRVVFGAHRA